MSKVYTSADQLVGKTPLLELVHMLMRRSVRFAGSIRPATGAATMLRTPSCSSVSAPCLKS